VLDNARMVDTLDEALDGISHLCATAMTPRDFGPPTRTPREHFEMLLKGELDVRLQTGTGGSVFGFRRGRCGRIAPSACNQKGVAFCSAASALA
jgi:tRNA/rRNA methyltransferase